MNFNSVGANANSVPAMPYTPATRKAAESQPATKPANPAVEEALKDLDDLLTQLTDVVKDAAKSKDASKAEALIELIASGADPVEAGAASGLPPAVLQLLAKVTGTVDAAGKGDEFKALLQEYVAVTWAIAELDAAIEAQENGASTPESDYHYEQLAAARAFMRQLEAAVSRRLDQLEAQANFANWREVYSEEGDSAVESESASFEIPQGLDASKIVALLLENAPKINVDKLVERLQTAAPQPAAAAAAAQPTNNPYH